MGDLIRQTEHGREVNVNSDEVTSGDAPEIPASDPNIAAAARARVGAQCWRLVAALRHGAKTNAQLQSISLRLGARVMDLRKVGFEITVRPVDHRAGIWLYTLVREPAWAESIHVVADDEVR